MGLVPVVAADSLSLACGARIQRIAR